ncbi:9047_t:CDS:2 [Diversispora eburnea]|uniref:9047_t:CDS:1 n=1 Tax=Diversispora eburnea TaxID=1213867 RepID=A0A9N9A1K2_9GLOM|nr:9047_t:CDS:2 [Diversispora eburnea]
MVQSQSIVEDFDKQSKEHIVLDPQILNHKENKTKSSPLSHFSTLIISKNHFSKKSLSSKISETHMIQLKNSDPEYLSIKESFIFNNYQPNIQAILKLQMPTKLEKAHEKYKKKLAKKLGKNVEDITHKMYHGTTSALECRLLAENNIKLESLNVTGKEIINYNADVIEEDPEIVEKSKLNFCNKEQCGVCGISREGNRIKYARVGGLFTLFSRRKMWFARDPAVSSGFCGYSGVIKTMFVIDVINMAHDNVIVKSNEMFTLFFILKQALIAYQSNLPTGRSADTVGLGSQRQKMQFNHPLRFISQPYNKKNLQRFITISSSSEFKKPKIEKMQPTIVIRPSEERGHNDHGWLNTYHTFSFSDYFNSEFMGFGNLRVINEDIVKPTKGFGKHSHREYEIFSYIISGELQHKDSGTGISHSEYNIHKTLPVHFLQIWALPDNLKLEPSYQTKTFPDSQKINNLVHIISPTNANNIKPNSNSTIVIHTDLNMFASILEPGHKIVHKVRDNFENKQTNAERRVYVHLTNLFGSQIKINEKNVLKKGDGAFITKVKSGDEIIFESEGNVNAEFVLFDIA